MNFEFEYARSGRAACKVCQGKIDKDALRIGTKLRVDKDKDGGSSATNHVLESTRWHHFRCFPKMRGVKWFKDHLPDASECSGFDALKEQDREHIVGLFGRCKGLDVPLPMELLTAPAESSVDPSTPAPEKKGRGQKRAADSGLEAATDGGLSPEQKALKTQSKCGLTAAQVAEIAEQKALLASKSMAQLGAILAKNGMSKTGKKEELVDRVAECRILGAWPLCPTCEKARLRFNRDSCTYNCPGHFDEDAKRMLRCRGPGKDVEVQRPAWQEVQPLTTSEEVAALGASKGVSLPEDDIGQPRSAPVAALSKGVGQAAPAPSTKPRSVQTLLLQNAQRAQVASQGKTNAEEHSKPAPDTEFSREVLTSSLDLPSLPSQETLVPTSAAEEDNEAALVMSASSPADDQPSKEPPEAVVVLPRLVSKPSVPQVRRSKYFT